jgi:hypothetical protein
LPIKPNKNLCQELNLCFLYGTPNPPGSCNDRCGGGLGQIAAMAEWFENGLDERQKKVYKILKRFGR